MDLEGFEALMMQLGGEHDVASLWAAHLNGALSPAAALVPQRKLKDRDKNTKGSREEWALQVESTFVKLKHTHTNAEIRAKRAQALYEQTRKR